MSPISENYHMAPFKESTSADASILASRQQVRWLEALDRLSIDVDPFV